ncbi:MAG: hypothetical protein B6D61_09565 [Bacteroidetes bacterium 4484_249]|nr:MAG: hypothetical protein B6D61_09565 [Bacteroidetes bacterium 4484_249]
MHYKLNIKPEAHQDIQEGIDWYNSKQTGLGKRFHVAVKQEFWTLRKIPFFQVRYDGIRCLPLKKFPYMIHYILEENKKQIIVLGVVNTYKNPIKWPGKK